ncbi:MAG: hypothetical protein ACMZ66_00900 [Thalassospira sp.]|uniref:hypothetical protein n=1 Tax=Thalassospira sp. TaxID=1912094 RepID=UPI003A85A1E8
MSVSLFDISIRRSGFIDEFESLIKTSDNSFKNSLVSGKISYQSFTADFNKVEIGASNQEISSKIKTDLFLGAERVRRQKIALDNALSKPTENGPWALITSYYFSFFCAIEISKYCGRFTVNLSPENVTDLKAQWDAQSSDHILRNIQQGQNLTLHCKISNDTKFNTSNIEITRCGSKPHDVVWQVLSGILQAHKSGLKNENQQSDADLFLKILGFPTRWPKPNSIRNSWNYQRSEYFQKSNYQYLLDQFFKNSGNLNQSYAWLRQHSISPNDPTQQTARISVLSNTLEASSNKVFELLEL